MQAGNWTMQNEPTVSEQEMLALVWATKQFRCYLFGKQFLEQTILH